MRSAAILSMLTGACFNVEVIGGTLECPDKLCPDGLTCEFGICFGGEADCATNIGVCAAPENGACFDNRGCSPSPECSGQPCGSGVVCVDEASANNARADLQEPNGALGVCLTQEVLAEGDPCDDLDVLQVCPIGTGCTQAGVCGSRAGELGDTCDTAIPVTDGKTFLNTSGFNNDSQIAVAVQDCIADSALGADIFLSYTVVNAGAEVRISTSNNGTFSDTMVYVGTACDANNPAILADTLVCDDDQEAEDPFNDFSSEVLLVNQAPGTTLLIVIDAFGAEKENFVEVTITEE